MTFLPYQFGSNPAADATIKSMQSRINQLEAELQITTDRYLKLLRVVEWSVVVTNERGHQRAACPYCMGRPDLKGHSKDCELATLLSASISKSIISAKCSEQSQNIDKQDAERYRWLRDHKLIETIHWEFDVDDIDSAIDAMREGDPS